MVLLVALADSEPGWAALEYALEEADETDGVVVVHAVDPSQSGYGEFAHFGTDSMQERLREHGEALLEQARDRVAERPQQVRTELLVGPPASSVVTYVTEHDVDRVIVGSHGRSGVSRVLLGSVAEQIARRAPAPVTIVR